MKREAPPLISQEEMLLQQQAIAAVSALPNRPETYCIVTYGCQMNAHDSETLSGMMEQMGMRKAEKEQADLVLFNTCCIRDNAERKALGNMTWLKQLKNKRKDMVLCVCGCMMQQEKMAKVILKQYPFFDVAFGTHNLYRFPSLLLKTLQQRRQMIEVLQEDGHIAEGMPICRDNPFKAYLTIAYGCNNFCSYCIVPYVRGRERSRNADDILREAEQLISDGVQEIMLLGQNVNSYGKDLETGISFPQLLRKLNALGVPRIRFMTSHPKDLSDELIAALAECSHVAKHLHLPVQSGSDAILRSMSRIYDRERYLERVASLRKAVPGIALSTDLIVGFPGETEQDFQDTLSLVRQVRYDSAYTFIYSPREGTRAAEMENRIPEDVSTDRITRLIAQQEAVTAEIYQSLIGTEQKVLIEEVSRRDATQLAGKASRGVTCNFTGDPAWIGQFARVKVREAGHNTLKADFIDLQPKEAPEWL